MHKEWHPLERWSSFTYPFDATILVRDKKLEKVDSFEFLEGFPDALNRLGADRVSLRARRQS